MCAIVWQNLLELCCVCGSEPLHWILCTGLCVATHDVGMYRRSGQSVLTTCDAVIEIACQ